jgi:amino acid permease
MPICWIETYTFLSYFSMAGISVAIVGMCCIFGYCFNSMATHTAVNSPVEVFDILGVLGHVGVAMFVFEGNAVIMNVRNETKDKPRYPQILVYAIVVTECLFMVFALVCYLTYKDQTMPIFTMNLAISGFTIFIRACVCFNALCSYPVQILAAFDIIEQNEYFKKRTKMSVKSKKMILRSIIIWIVTGISLLVPDFTDFLNIAGSIGSAMIAFVLPPLLYLK